MLTREAILSFLKAQKQDFAFRYSVSQIGLFGSYIKGTMSEASDIDILVKLEEPTLDHYMDLKFALQGQFGKTVDLVLIDPLKPRLAPIITEEVVYA